jgi:multidrug efflux system membrane fusion protein
MMNNFKKKLILITIIAAGIVCLLSSCSRESQGVGKQKGREQAAVPVTVAAAVTKDMPIELSTFGTVRANSSVPIKAEVGGTLMKVHFQKGQNVNAGDLLFTIDPRPYRSSLEQAQANLLRDKAQAENALVNAERSKTLVEKGFIAQSDYDKAQADAKALAATLRADEAAVVNAKLQLEHCSIRSPISGRTGDTLVDEGTLVKANDVTLVTINRIHPIEVVFNIPQSYLSTVRSSMTKQGLQVTAGIPKDIRPPEIGRLIFVNNTVDPTTGTIELAAVFNNDREVLWPGQYVHVTLVLAVRKDAVVVPSTAVQTGQKGKYVFVVKPDQTVEMRPVTAGMATGAETIIENGLKVGERVVTDGQLRLVPGAKIDIKAEPKSQNTLPSDRS